MNWPVGIITKMSKKELLEFHIAFTVGIFFGYKKYFWTVLRLENDLALKNSVNSIYNIYKC
jgi:hypothetical protein